MRMPFVGIFSDRKSWSKVYRISNLVLLGPGTGSSSSFETIDAGSACLPRSADRSFMRSACSSSEGGLVGTIVGVPSPTVSASCPSSVGSWLEAWRLRQLSQTREPEGPFLLALTPLDSLHSEQSASVRYELKCLWHTESPTTQASPE